MVWSVLRGIFARLVAFSCAIVSLAFPLEQSPAKATAERPAKRKQRRKRKQNQNWASCMGVQPPERPIEVQWSLEHKLIAFARHGEGEHNAQGSPWLRDPLLTGAGFAEAGALGTRLKQTPVEFELLICSPLRRCIQTASEVLRALEYPLPVLLTPLHTEVWSGKCDEGTLEPELLRQFPQMRSWHRDLELKTRWWSSRQEQIGIRTERFRQFLAVRAERRILVISSRNFLAKLLCVSRRRLATGQFVMRNWASANDIKGAHSLSVFVDNSNICLSAQRQFSSTGALLGVDRSLSLQVAPLVKLVEGDRHVLQRWVVGSKPSQLPGIREQWAAHGYVGRWDGREGKEVEVDDTLQSLILKTASSFRARHTIVLLTGDGNSNYGRGTFPRCVEVALTTGHCVEVWAWEFACSGRYLRLWEQYAPRLAVHFLDGREPPLVAAR